MNMQLLMQYAWTLAARTRRYHFGGDDPIQGFDCSGLVMELMIAAGILQHGSDMNAQALCDHFSHNGSFNSWGPGALAFYGKDMRKVTHVAFCLDNQTMLEAGGGDSGTTTDEAAIRQNAFIRMRPIKYRKDFLCVIKPFYPGGFNA